MGLGLVRIYKIKKQNIKKKYIKVYKKCIKVYKNKNVEYGWE